MVGDQTNSSFQNPQRVSDKYKFSIVIPVFDEANRINHCIEHVLKSQKDETYEIIVVDGNSNGETVNAVNYPDVTKIVSSKGRAKQMNAGAGLAQGEILLFLHADTKLPDDALKKAAKVLKNGKYVGGAFDLEINSNRLTLKLIAACASIRSRSNRIPYGDQAIFIRRTYFEDIGRFKEIPLMEDVDLMRRIKRRGDKIFILPDKTITSARRWETEGALYTTIRNQLLVSSYYLGIAPDKLSKFYKICSNAANREQ